MPEKSAAVSLPPTANTARPHWKRVISTWKTSAERDHDDRRRPSRPGCPAAASRASSLLDTSKYRPSVMMNAAPRVMPITPSVAMNGGSSHEHDQRRRSAARAAAPTSSAGGIAGAERPAALDEELRRRPRPPAPSPRRATRSTPPEMITIAAPTAAMP